MLRHQVFAHVHHIHPLRLLRIGDVRVRWRAIERAPAPAGTVIVDGRWELPATATAGVASAPRPASPAPQAAPTRSRWFRLFGDRLLWLISAGVLLALALLAWRKQR
jgi:hypothetical protein